MITVRLSSLTVIIMVNYRVHTDPGKSRNVKFKFSGLKSRGIRPMYWKVKENQPTDCRIFDPCICFWLLYTLSLSNDRLGSALVNCVVIKYNEITIT